MMRETRIEERRLEQQMLALEAHQQRTKASIEREWRVEHWGKEPVRSPAWRSSGATPLPRRNGTRHAAGW